jgi:hypothetical protein
VRFEETFLTLKESSGKIVGVGDRGGSGSPLSDGDLSPSAEANARVSLCLRASSIADRGGDGKSNAFTSSKVSLDATEGSGFAEARAWKPGA